MQRTKESRGLISLLLNTDDGSEHFKRVNRSTCPWIPFGILLIGAIIFAGIICGV
jgi:hypothetical protein